MIHLTLQDVAREAGVSKKTVSRVINGEPHVRAETAARVSETVARLGYRPNELARSLTKKRSRTVGLMIADISNPFYAVCAKAVEEVTRERGYAVILCASDENKKVEQTYVRLLTQRRIDGLLIFPTSDGHDYLQEEQTAGLPIVAMDRPVEGIATDTVVFENQAGAREATQHLIEHGHRRVAFIGDNEQLYTTLKRLDGYRQAVKHAGIEEICQLGVSDVASAMKATNQILELPEPPTAIFTMNNLITVGAFQALRRSKVSVPEQVALIGFGDFALASELVPSLTLVRQPSAELGRIAATFLLERLDGYTPSEVRRTVLPTTLVVRQSCGCEERMSTNALREVSRHTET